MVKVKPKLPNSPQREFLILETDEQREFLLSAVKVELLRILNTGQNDVVSKIEERAERKENGEIISVSVVVETPIIRYWMTPTEIIKRLSSGKSEITISKYTCYYHLHKLKEAGLIEQYPLPSKKGKSKNKRVRGMFFRAIAKKYVPFDTEQLLRESEARYKKIYENLNVGLLTTSIADGKVLECNSNLAEIIGFESRDQAIAEGLSVERYRNPEKREEIISELMKSGVYNGEIALTKMDGTSIWVEARSVIDLEEGIIHSVLTDITDRKKIEEDLQQSKARLNRNQELAKMGFLTLNLKTNEMLWSDEVFSIYGIDKNQVQPTLDSTVSLVYPDDLKYVQESLSSAIEGSTKYDTEHRIIKPDGEIIWVHAQGDLIYDISGNPTTLIGTVVDITERKHFEEALRESEQRNRIIVDAMNDLVILQDVEGRYVEYFAQDNSLLVRPWSELKNRKPEEIVSQDLATQYHEYAKKVRETGEPVTYEYQLEINGVLKWFQGTMILHEDRESIVVAIKDITDRINAEISLYENEERLKIAGMISYDIIYEWDVTTDSLKWFGNIDTFLGYEEGEISRKIQSWLKLIHSDDKSKLEDAVELHRTSIEPINYEYRIKHKDGMFRYWSDRAFPLLNSENKPYKWIGVCTDITERKLAEEALIRSEQRNRIIANAMSDLILVYDKDSRLREYYTSDESLLYTPLKKMYGKKIEEFMPNDYTDAYYNHLQQMRETGEPVTYEYQLEINGVLKWFQGTMMFHEDLESIVVAIKDITEHKISEQALRESEERHRLVLSSMNDLIFVISKDNIYTDYYASEEQKMSVPIEMHIGRNVADVLPPDVAQKFIECMKRVRESGNREEFEYSMIEDGREEWYSTVLDMHNDRDSIVQTSRNITLRKIAEDDVKRRESEYRTLVSNILGAVYHCAFDTNWTMFFLSDTFEDISGYPVSDFIMNKVRSFNSIIHPEDRKYVYDEIIEYTNKGLSYVLEYRILDVDREIHWVRDYGQKILESDKGLEYLDGVIFDVTDEKLAQEDMIQQAARTKQAADTALLYLDIMSHDIRNQLQAVIMASETLEHTDLSVENIIMIDIITESVKKSEKLINKVLSTRELLSTSLFEFSLVPALEKSIESLKNQHDDVKIIVKYPSRDFIIRADKFIEQAFINILENAIETNKRKVRKIWINIKKVGQGFQVSIADNGQGMTKEKRESLFDPSRRFGGVGIHQTIRILQKYGGHISVHDRVESNSAQGAEFRLWFPIAKSNLL